MRDDIFPAQGSERSTVSAQQSGQSTAAERWAALAPLPRLGSATAHVRDAALSDEQLSVTLVAALDADRFVPNAAITVTVRERIATLTGAVSWAYQRTAAHETAALIPGILGAVNAITVEPHAWQQPDRLAVGSPS